MNNIRQAWIDESSEWTGEQLEQARLLIEARKAKLRKPKPEPYTGPPRNRAERRREAKHVQK